MNIKFKTTFCLYYITNLAFSKENPSFAIVNAGQSNYYNNNSYTNKPQTDDAYFGEYPSYLGFQSN